MGDHDAFAEAAQASANRRRKKPGTDDGRHRSIRPQPSTWLGVISETSGISSNSAFAYSPRSRGTRARMRTPPIRCRAWINSSTTTCVPVKWGPRTRASMVTDRPRSARRAEARARGSGPSSPRSRRLDSVVIVRIAGPDQLFVLGLNVLRLRPRRSSRPGGRRRRRPQPHGSGPATGSAERSPPPRRNRVRTLRRTRRRGRVPSGGCRHSARARSESADGAAASSP